MMMRTRRERKMTTRKTKTWCVIMNGARWYTGIRSEAKADAEAIRCRRLGLGTAYVERE